MAIELKGITQKYGDLTALDNVNLLIEEGEMIALIGPSGCGKSTLLRTIAGLLPLEHGRILFNDHDISNLAPQERNAVIVFQNYALFPHMTVEENIAYGLKIRKTDKLKINEKVAEILNKVELAGLNQRKISELSGGQQQRVALARALVVEPSILLFDEPLSNLDQKLRVSMRQKIRKIQQEYGITSIYVTHDQEEAISISDRIVVMKEGIVEQVGSPGEVYFKPRNRFVAEFLGTANIVKLSEITGTRDYLEGRMLGDLIKIPWPDSQWEHRTSTLLMFRPEDVEIREDGQFAGIVQWQETLGPVKKITIESHGHILFAEKRKYHKSGPNYMIGDKIRFAIDMKEAHVIDD